MKNWLKEKIKWVKKLWKKIKTNRRYAKKLKDLKKRDPYTYD